MTDIRINNVRIIHLAVPLEHIIKTAFGSMSERHAIFIEITDGDGHTGLGETWVNYPKWAPWERKAAFEQVYTPYLKGRTFTDIGKFIAEMAKNLRGPSVQSRTIGPLIQSLCGIELALWDLKAKTQNVSLSKLLFPDPAPKVPVYASGLNSPIPWQRIDRFLERGVTTFKLKIGFGEEDLRNLKELSAYLDGKARIAVDANRAWSFKEVTGKLGMLNDFNVLWLEEPLKPEEEDRFQELVKLSPVPIAAGENCWIEPGRDDPEAVAGLPYDLFQPDITKNATLSDTLKLLKALNGTDKNLYPHFFGNGPGQLACLHLASGCGDILQEMDVSVNPLLTDIFTTPIPIENGTVTLTDKPGLGWEIDYDKIENWNVE